MKVRSNETDLVKLQRDLIRIIYAVCMSFCEFRITDEQKALIAERSAKAKAKLWFPDGVYQIVQVYENNDMSDPNINYASLLSIIGSLAKGKHSSHFSAIHKLLRNRSDETNLFYFILSQLDNANKKFNDMLEIGNNLLLNFKQIECFDIFSLDKSHKYFHTFVTDESHFDEVVQILLANHCYKTLKSMRLIRNDALFEEQMDFFLEDSIENTNALITRDIYENFLRDFVPFKEKNEEYLKLCKLKNSIQRQLDIVLEIEMFKEVVVLAAKLKGTDEGKNLKNESLQENTTYEERVMQYKNEILELEKPILESEKSIKVFQARLTAFSRGAGAGALFGHFPIELGARIGSFVTDYRDIMSLKSTCKKARTMAISYENNEVDYQESLKNRPMLKQ